MSRSLGPMGRPAAARDARRTPQCSAHASSKGKEISGAKNAPSRLTFSATRALQRTPLPRADEVVEVRVGPPEIDVAPDEVGQVARDRNATRLCSCHDTGGQAGWDVGVQLRHGFTP